MRALRVGILLGLAQAVDYGGFNGAVLPERAFERLLVELLEPEVARAESPDLGVAGDVFRDEVQGARQHALSGMVGRESSRGFHQKCDYWRFYD
ncbi:uncharacterized protein BcabD6B2_53950 [Babesia caballi]|uniref:Uncharacterized protein n=1 Tax=Babesia caballi TaxID=5871 RepID=A0AAV4M1Q9_BABCB|nr:hypothetical protein BcabD6B2_53950 [Babesia caballi]